jgi:DNA-directed RNA polymerase specialized sigma24 family protein
MFAGVRKLHYAALRQSAALPPPQPETQSSKEDGLESDELLGIFRALRDEQREALILTVASGLSHEQAAEVCDCQIDTVKSRVLDAWFEISRMLYQDSVIMTHGPNHVVRWT